jgi:rhodanese-related sulfurtransferase
MEGESTIDAQEARKQVAGGDAQALDVRDREEFRHAHVPGAVHIEIGELESRLGELSTEVRWIVVGDDGDSGGEAAALLRDRGYDAAAVKKGMKAWISERFNVQPTSDPDVETMGDDDLANPAP